MLFRSDSANFESHENVEVFRRIGKSVSEAFEQFGSYPIIDFDTTTRSNMLNNLVVNSIQKNCEDQRFRFYPTLTNTRRSLAILDDKYILFFKKSPFSNVKTNQDDLIKNQELNKHIIFIVYSVDDFWSSIEKSEFQYFSSPSNVSYTYDISKYLTQQVIIPFQTQDDQPNPVIRIKEGNIEIKKAQ